MKLLFMNKVIIIMKARSIIMILNKILRRTIAYNLDDKKRRKACIKRPGEDSSISYVVPKKHFQA